MFTPQAPARCLHVAAARDGLAVLVAREVLAP